MAVATKTESKARVTVPPWGIEADHPCNAILTFQSLVGLRLRSRIISHRTVNDKVTGEQMVPIDIAAGLGRLPEVPGMRLYVNPKEQFYRVEDPLYNNDEMLDKITRAIQRATNINNFSRLNGEKPLQVKVGDGCDIHQFKTLVREMLRFVQSGEARVIAGPTPDIEDIDGLPGRYLQNPGAIEQNLQPRFEDQMDEWLQKLSLIG